MLCKSERKAFKVLLENLRYSYQLPQPFDQELMTKVKEKSFP